MGKRNKYRRKGGSQVRTVVAGSAIDSSLSRDADWKIVTKDDAPADEPKEAVVEPMEATLPEQSGGWLRRVFGSGD